MLDTAPGCAVTISKLFHCPEPCARVRTGDRYSGNIPTTQAAPLPPGHLTTSTCPAYPPHTILIFSKHACIVLCYTHSFHIIFSKCPSISQICDPCVRSACGHYQYVSVANVPVCIPGVSPWRGEPR